MRQISEEGVILDDTVETLGVDVGTRVKRLGEKEKAWRKKCKVRFAFIELNESGGQEGAMCVYDATTTCGVHAMGMDPMERLKLRRQMVAAASK